MRTSGLARRLVKFSGLAGAAALLVTTGTTGASAAGSTGWKIISTVGSKTSEVNNGDIVVTGAANAWTTWTCGPCASGTGDQNLMEHWNGQAWSAVTLPSALQYPAVIAGEQASSASNYWVFIEGNKADVFNGSGWTLKSLPTWVERPIDGNDVALASAVFSSANVWAFSIDAASNPTLAGHYSSGTWHKVTLPVTPNEAAGLAANDIWLYGFLGSSGPRTLAHWNGTSWATVSLPAAPPGDTLIASGMVALGAKSVWLDGELFTKSGVSFELLHWNGSSWSTTGVPASVGEVNQFASDGASGFWLIATADSGGTSVSHFVHYTGGKWDSFPIPTQDKLTSEPGVLASVPGSQSMWSIGFLVNGSTPEFGETLGYAQP